jgi:hypothetical protein
MQKTTRFLKGKVVADHGSIRQAWPGMQRLSTVVVRWDFGKIAISKMLFCTAHVLLAQLLNNRQAI